jgi:hypothetical protein
MFDRSNKYNPILAIAIQARSAEQREAREREQALRAERESTEHFRRLGSASENAFSTGIPMVCTIH